MLSTTVINSFKNLKILCIGDIMLDKFMYGEVERISPEAPVPIFKITKEKTMLGGIGNVIANLSSLKIKTMYIGATGKDESSAIIENYLKDTGCEYSLIQPENYPTTTKIRMIANNNHLIRADKETELKLDKNQINKFKSFIEKALPKCHIVLVSDYKKGLLTKETTQIIIELCKQYGKKVLIDPKERDFSKYAGADIVKPNLKEFELVSGKKFDISKPDFKQRIAEEAYKVMENQNIDNLLITLSKDGMIFVSSDKTKEVWHIPAEAKEVFDVSGAGDTSLAVLGASIAAGVYISDAMKLANLASGIVVGKLGTACVTPSELRTAIIEENAKGKLTQGLKIITKDEAVDIIKELKSQGKTIGFTNGCFDLLHLGHIHSFANAKKECDYLFVGINSDKSVKKVRGESFPLQDEKTRSYVVASLEFVDYVVLFDEDTALELVKNLNPDVIAKEGFKIENWPEAQFVQANGGKVIELERIEDYSTSAVINKMNSIKNNGVVNV